MGEAGGKNIEHPHTLAILRSFFWLQMHFSFIGKAQFGRATLFCDSSYCKFPLMLKKVFLYTASLHTQLLGDQ